MADEVECTRCFIIKPLTNFPTGKNRGKLYYYSYCRVCYNKRKLKDGKKYKQKNRKMLSEKQREYAKKIQNILKNGVKNII